jgi:PhnB protein
MTMSQIRKIPEGYNTLQPYIICENTLETIAFLSKVFSATERLVMKDDKGRIAHAEVAIGNCVLMMADEHPEIEANAPAHYGGSPVSLMIYVDDCDTTYAAALAAGATSVREPADQPYGDRMAGVRDPFGYKWWIGHSLAAESNPK